MVEENINQEFRLKNIDERGNYLLEEIKQSKFISRKYKVCTTLNHIEHFLILASYWLYFNFLFSWYSYRNYEFCGRIKNICNNQEARSQKCNSIIKEKKKKHDKIVLLAKSKLNNIKALISKALID